MDLRKYPLRDFTKEIREKVRQREQEKETWKLARNILVELEDLDRRYRGWKRRRQQ